MTSQTHLLRSGIFVGGEWIEPKTPRTTWHVNPVTGERQAEIGLAGEEEVQRAVDAARQALPAWKALPSIERSRLLRALGAQIRAAGDELATINALETGTPIKVGRGLFQTDSYFEYYAGWVDKYTGNTITTPDGGLQLTLLEPVGVVGIIVTWNSPMGMVLMAVSAALAAGCTVVLKPAEQAPFAVIKFAELCQAAGLPAGVLNVIPGDAQTGAALVANDQIDKISFTGGTATARTIMRTAADALTPVLAELGGKSPFIVFPDAAIDRAADGAARITRMSGQVCVIGSRVLVHEDVHDELVDQILARFDKTVIGDPLDPATDMGPLINASACERVGDMVHRAVTRDGAELRAGGSRLEGALSSGFYFPPTLLTNVRNDSEIAQEEIFGPVLTVSTFRDEDEAVRMANHSRYGLAAYVHTADLSRAMRLASSLVAGGVAFNGLTLPAGYTTPFGGVKQSGHGRQGGYEGIAEFLHTKTVLIPAQ